MSEFGDIKDYAGWRALLQKLLTEASGVVDGDRSSRREVADRLVSFVVKSFPNNDAIKELDKIAGKAATNLLIKNIHERVQAITKRQVQFAQVSKRFDSLTTKDQDLSAGAPASPSGAGRQ